jgi:hypothetical protein
MQLTIRTKIAFGFVILAFGMMFTDVCRLLRAPSDPPAMAGNVLRVSKL